MYVSHATCRCLTRLTLHQLFYSLTLLLHFADVHSRMLRPLVDSCVEVYTAACAALLPTPFKSHYRFNFRDMSRLLSGILSISPAACGGDVPAALTRLWTHEVQRVFGDRLVCGEDRAWLRQLQQELLVSKFGWQVGPRSSKPEDQVQLQDTATGAGGGSSSSVGLVAPGTQSSSSAPSLFGGAAAAAQACVASDALFNGPDQVLFGDFSKLGASSGERVYEPLAGVSKLASLLERYLDKFNISGGKAASAASAAAAAAAEGGGAHSSDGKQQQEGSRGSGGSRLDLVFFEDAVLHVVRLARVLRQPR